MAKRPPIPSDLERQVLVEAGHRCAIPACRQVPVEIAHIISWTKCKEHNFDNLVPLCPTCHTRYDQGEIDRKAMLTYKFNLAILNRRYGDLEVRVLKFFARNPGTQEIALLADFRLLLENLLEDNLLLDTGKTQPADPVSGLPRKIYAITQEGRAYVENWLSLDQPK